MNQELSIKIILELEKTPEQSQRVLSKRCGVSLGSIHYCINALMEKGYVKARNFKNAQNKVCLSLYLDAVWHKSQKRTYPGVFAEQAGRVWGAAARDQGAGAGSRAVTGVEAGFGMANGRNRKRKIMRFGGQ